MTQEIRGAFTVLVFITCSLMACHGMPKELAKVQGSWQFDEKRYLESLHAMATSPDDLEKKIHVYEFGKKNGTPIMSDLLIADLRIVTTAGTIRQQFDLSDCTFEPGHIKAKALWHEDHRDLGDARTVEINLWIEGSSLILALTDDGNSEQFHFKKK